MQVRYDPQKKARRSDPQISKLSAHKAKEISRSHTTCILRALKGSRSMTAEEIGHFCGLDTVQVCRRLKEMQEAYLIITTGQSRLNSKGRSMRLWTMLA